MSIYDTRFFVEHYYSKDAKILKKTREEAASRKEKYVSSVTVHELFRLTLEKEGREVAQLRADLMEKDFKVIAVDARVGRSSAEIRSQYRVPMADSMIAATAKLYGMKCVTDDPHLIDVKEIKTRWIG